MTMFEYAKKAYITMKEKSPKERWDYFLEYYKWPALAILLAIVLLVHGIVSIANRKDTVFSGVLINSLADSEQVDYDDKFGEFIGMDSDKEEVRFYTDIALTGGQSGTDVDAFQTLLAGIATKDTDFIVGQEDSFEKCAYHTSNMFADLRNILDAETLAQLEGRLYYIDKAVMEEIRDSVMTMPELPDPFNPEAMTEPIPVGIDISQCEAFQKVYYPSEDVSYLGVVINSTRIDTTLQFIDYLLSE